nr:MAG TPA: hypothetical protein [Bacteriophage sp.]
MKYPKSIFESISYINIRICYSITKIIFYCRYIR